MSGGHIDQAILSADYVIIGAGSAGSALAARLSEDGKNSVIIIEYGGSDIGPLIQMPAALSYPMNMRLYDWGFKSEEEKHLNNRRLVTPRGKVIGGSSSINGMVYVRGHGKDFDQWEQMGANGWAYADVLPYFKRMESVETGENADQSWRGHNGPLHITKETVRHPLFDAFIAAGAKAGFEPTSDYNGHKQEGFASMQRTIYRGRRWSAANAYLKPALKRKNLTLLRGLAQKIIIKDKRAIGVSVRTGARSQMIAAKREIIIAASSINSPKLLMLSGIGPADHLREHGIEIIADRPGVGGNLQDHLEVYVQQECTKPITLNSKLGLLSKALIGAEWLLFKTGAGASNHFGCVGFVRSKPGVEYPDIQFHFLPAAIRYDGSAPANTHGFQAHIGPMRSRSRGEVRLKSSDPFKAPSIRFNYMSHDEDWRDFRHAIRLAREIFAQSPFDPYRGAELAPGDDIQSDAALDSFIRQHAESAFHPCGTCKMGDKNDPYAVVDPECRVIGVDGLRVADSSIFPQITNGNLNAPSIMTGEKAADHILGRPMLARANLEPWIHPNWKTSDR